MTDTANKAALLEWVEELETTDKPQAKKYLNIPGVGLCCLGIACELFADRLDLRREEDYGSLSAPPETVIRYRQGGEYGGKSLLPDSVADYLGFGYLGSVTVTYQGVLQDVTRLNDTVGLSFKEIAALIREEYDL